MKLAIDFSELKDECLEFQLQIPFKFIVVLLDVVYKVPAAKSQELYPRSSIQWDFSLGKNFDEVHRKKIWIDKPFFL